MPFKNKLALIDLTKREVSIEEIPHEIQTKYLGGRGMNMYLLAKRFHPGIDPLGPENPLIFGLGFLTGWPYEITKEPLWERQDQPWSLRI